MGAPPQNVQSVPFADTSLIDFGRLPTVGAPKQISITNTSSAPLPLALSVDAPGISAKFDHTQGPRMLVRPHQAAAIDLTSDPLHAGPIKGMLVVSISHSSSHALTIPLTGSQAPVGSPSLTATPAAKGAVNLAWAPSPSSGVSAYVVERAAGTTGAWQNIATLQGTATSTIDQTGTDGTFTYRVIAEAPAATTSEAPVESPVGPEATAAAVATPPASPADIASHSDINRDDVTNGSPVVIPVDLNQSSATDTVTVTLTDSAGATATGQASGGVPTANVKVFGVGALADGTITVSATVADSLGNTSNPVAGPPIFKDTQAPAAPTVSAPPIIGANVDAVPVTVGIDPATAAAGDATVSVQMSDGEHTTPPVPGNQTDNDATVVVPVDASGLSDTPTPDEGIRVTATVTDEAGNTSQSGVGFTGMDTSGPSKPTSFGVAAGPDNPAGVVTAQSASAVIVQATFDQPPAVDDQIKIWVNGQGYALTPDGDSTTLTLDPPLNLSGLPDGTYKLGMMQTDADGNQTFTRSQFTVDTGGAEAPTDVGVPAGPDNPAGYVNAATQTAATIVATFAGPTDPADQISLTVGGMPLPTESGGSDQISWTADLSNLPDGTLPISGTIVDPNGVTSTFSGSLIKDTQPPPAPAVAYVVGPPPNTIKPADASCVKVLVAFNRAPDPNDVVNVTLSDGSTSAEGSASAGDGHVLVGCIDASSLAAGTISVDVTVTDVAGNSTDMTGTPAALLNCTPNQGEGQGQTQGQ